MSKTTYYHNKETGYSRATIHNKYGHFHGVAFCSEEDMPTFSAYAGERYAEIRATIRYAKFRYKQEKIKLNTVKALKKEILNDNKCAEEKASLRRVNIKIRDYTQSMEDWQNLYKYLEDSLKKQIEQREKILQRTKKDK